MAAGTSSLRQIFEGPNGEFIALVTGVVVVLCTIVLLVLLRKQRRRGNSLLFVGLTDSGKTLLFNRLLDGSHVMTHTSMKENVGSYKLKGKKSGKQVNMVDLPGHDRIRSQFLEKYKEQARAILFVVDSVNFPREVRDVAEQMYDILSHKTLMRAAVPILVVCNKQDFAMAKSARAIKAQLEKEINTQRVTRSAALQGLDGSSKSALVGKKGKDFEFADVEPVKVEFVECSAKGNADNKNPQIDALHDWIEKAV
ncbi:signal recognition particle receptor subunit beta [Nematostella vectensis]|uniref:signal recognition particle receptor subunit beta n=1 Tax=Nematostella vectensis TaxID=45351 RepID=UPI001390457F|nr:signal recognition particle receptor subunit beta [Nematostella vectensis]